MICSSEGHDMHICTLKSRGELATIKILSANAMVKCDTCGAMANNPEDVCDPVQLPDIRDVGDGTDVR